ncbi:glycosyltransferase family protein [Asaia krungthepensis]|uniref:hypothetical protein n=1 Tax=Asaia krungthepensis TaxID=220990 RepID=UPI00223152FA|nr:hypothetical protein [Asaia krungthepensis]
MIALWQVAALPEAEAHMRLALHSGNHRDLALWPLAESLSMRPVSFECIDGDPFFNINTADDLAHARRVMGRAGDQSML